MSIAAPLKRDIPACFANGERSEETDAPPEISTNTSETISASYNHESAIIPGSIMSLDERYKIPKCLLVDTRHQEKRNHGTPNGESDACTSQPPAKIVEGQGVGCDGDGGGSTLTIDHVLRQSDLLRDSDGMGRSLTLVVRYGNIRLEIPNCLFPDARHQQKHDHGTPNCGLDACTSQQQAKLVEGQDDGGDTDYGYTLAVDPVQRQSDILRDSDGIFRSIRLVVLYGGQRLDERREIPYCLFPDTRHQQKHDHGTPNCDSDACTSQQPAAKIVEGQDVGGDDDEGSTLAVDPVQRQSDILRASDGTARGAYVSLADDEHSVLDLLRNVYADIEKKLGQVQTYTKHLLHYNLNSPGFPVLRGSDDENLFSSYNHEHVREMEALITSKIRQALVEIEYCAADQELQLYLSFLKSLKTEVQPPHIDYQWQNISPPDFTKRPRSYKGNYKEWVPFVALFPLTTDGMTVEVWNARLRHNIPKCPMEETGVLVDIPFGKILLLRADVVHAGGFATAASGNPRGHFYIYKTPRGVQHSYPLSNCYDTEIGGDRVPLLEFYKHCIESVDTSSVKFVRFTTKRQPLV
jgi:hypothetical protein